mmetsp:Transcript_23695/g.60505  ORF Transcript_23695/g.60505 Transcript_23695/m.60505 type:complete len:233 (+) Transcript_23695:474-1172(+)
MVDSTSVPPGASTLVRVLMKSSGRLTCSSTSDASTTSYSLLLPLLAAESGWLLVGLLRWWDRSSRGMHWYLTLLAVTGSSCAWLVAACTFSCVMSMPCTCAPMRAMLSDRMPPPHPTSSSLRPLNGSGSENSRPLTAHTASRMNLQRAGFMRSRGAKGPAGSHHWLASAANLAASFLSMLLEVWLALAVLCMRKWVMMMEAPHGLVWLGMDVPCTEHVPHGSRPASVDADPK